MYERCANAAASATCGQMNANAARVGATTVPALASPRSSLRKAVSAFMIAFDTNMAPAVGQQVTLTASNAATVGPRLDLLVARATAGECDLVAKAATGWSPTFGYYLTGGRFQGDLTLFPPISDADLRTLARLQFFQAITYTCVPPGSGARIGVDRDGDGWADGDETWRGTDPANPGSHP